MTSRCKETAIVQGVSLLSGIGLGVLFGFATSGPLVALCVLPLQLLCVAFAMHFTFIRHRFCECWCYREGNEPR